MEATLNKTFNLDYFSTILEDRIKLNLEFNHIVQSSMMQHLFHLSSSPSISEYQEKLTPPTFRIEIDAVVHETKKRFIGKSFSIQDAKFKALKKFFKFIILDIEDIELEEIKIEQCFEEPFYKLTNDDLNNKFNNLKQDKNKQLIYKIEGFGKTLINKYFGDTNFTCTIDYYQIGKHHQIAAYGSSKSEAKTNAIKKFFENQEKLDFRVNVVGQMETTVGIAEAVDSTEKETIVTTDTIIAETVTDTSNPQLLVEASASGIISSYQDLTSRWLILSQDQLVANTAASKLPWKSYEFPEIFLESINSPNVLPFKQYKLIRPIYEVKVKFNSNKFNQGRIVISYLHQAQQISHGITDQFLARKSYRYLNQALQRDHVMIDLNESNEAILTIPFLNTNNFVPLFAKADEISLSNVIVDIYILSALHVPDEAQQYINFVVMGRMQDAQFTALRPAISNANEFRLAEGQMNIVSGLLGSLAGPILEAGSGLVQNVVGGVVNAGMGAIGNLLSPVLGKLNPQRRSPVEEMFGNTPSIPSLDKPADHSQPSEFRISAVGDMAVAVRSEPKLSMRLDSTVLTPSLFNHFPDKQPTSISELTRIWSYHDRFTWSTAQQTPGEQIYQTFAEPGMGNMYYEQSFLGYFAQMYTMYSGTIEFRFDIVGTQFHTGSLSIGWIPFSDTFTEEEARSAYFKYIDIREQKQTTFNIPFIDTNVLRIITNQIEDSQAVSKIGSLKVFVQNALVPIGTVTPSVEVLVFVRAGEDFHFTGLQNSNLYVYRPNTVTAQGQMDTGEKENEDSTSLFPTLSASGITINIGEDHELIPDILKRWVLVESTTVTSTHVKDLNYPFIINSRSNPSAMIMGCFRYKRGGECFMFVFEQIEPTPVYNALPRDVNITPMITNTYTPPTALPVPQPLGSYAIVNNTVPPSSANLLTPVQTSTQFFSTGVGMQQLHANTTENSPLTPVQYYTTGASSSPFSNDILNKGVSDLTSINTTINGNNSKINTVFGENNTFATLSKNNVIGLRNAMDTNVGLNNFTITTQSSVNSINNQLGSLSTNFNTNANNTNYNNLNIANAISEGDTGIISAVTPATIKIGFQPPNIQSNIHLNDPFRGIPSQLICTDLNRTAKIYIPSYTLFNYQSWANTSNLKKEVLATTLGRIIISTTKPVKMEVYWSAGDDMYPCKVIGVPYSSTIPVNSRDNAEAQMDDLPSCSTATLPTTRTYSDFIRDTRDRGYSSFLSASSSIISPFKKIYNCPDKIDRVCDSVESTMKDLRECANNILDYLVDKFKWITNTGPIFSAILHLLQCFLNPSVSSCLIAIAGILTSLGLLTVQYTTKIIDFLVMKLQNKQPLTTEQHTVSREGAQGQCDHTECQTCSKLERCHENCQQCSELRSVFDVNTCATLGGLIIGAIGASLGLKSLPSSTGLCTGLFKISSTFWTSITHSVKFLKDLINVFVRAFKRCGFKSPATLEAMTLTNDKEGIKSFVEEAQLMLHQLNRTAVIQSPKHKQRFWLCVAKAYSLQAKLIQQNQAETRAILSLCDKVIKLGNELSIQATNCPIRYEPFVLALIGESAVGKSYLLNAILPELLADKGEFDSKGKLISKPGLSVETYEQSVYTRTAGVEYWNGYSSQPAILYDDFLASTDPSLAAQQIIEMYNLKSSAIMNCNMADINEKSLQANPFLVALAMNKHIAPNGITCPKAFKRRKDAFFKVSLKTKTQGQKQVLKQRSEYTEEQIRNFDHLIFFKCADVSNENSIIIPGMSYVQFKQHLKEMIREYHEKERKNVQFRFEKMKLTLPTVAQEMLNETDPFQIFYSSYFKAAETSPIQTGLLPSQVVELQMRPFLNAQNALALLPEGQDSITHWVKTAKENMKNRINSYPKLLREKLIRSVFGPHHADVLTPGECIICREIDQIPFKVCENNPSHFVCNGCSQAYGEMNSGRVLKCLICVSASMWEVDVHPVTFKSFVRQIIKNIYSSIPTFGELIRCKKFMFGASITYVYLLNVFMSKLASEQQFENDKFFSSLFDVDFKGEIVRNAFYITHYYPDGQGDFDNEGFSLIKAPAFKYYHRSEIYPKVISVNGICLHEELLRAQAGDLSYSWNRNENKDFGYWHISLGTSNIPDNMCSAPDCNFTNERRKSMILNYKEYCSSRILMEIRNLQANPDSIIVNVLPDFMSPEFKDRENEYSKALRQSISTLETVSFWDRLKGLWSKYGFYIKTALAVVTSIASVISGWKFISNLMYEPEGHLASSGDFKTLKLPKRQKPTRMVTANGQSDIDEDLVYRKISNNTIFISVRYQKLDGSVCSIIARGLGLFNRSAIFTKHEIQAILTLHSQFKLNQITNFECSFRPFNQRGSSTVEQLTILFDCDNLDAKFFSNDLTVVQTPNTMPQFKDIVNLIASEKQHENDYGNLTMIVTSKKTSVIQVVSTPIKQRLRQVKTADTDLYKNIESWDCYMTNFGTKGDCGIVGLVRANSPILCFHIAGIPTLSEGYCLPLIREDFIELKKDNLPYESWIPILKTGQGSINLEGNIWKVGTVKKNDIPYMSEKTKIIPSLLNGNLTNIPTLTYPGILSSRDPRYNHSGSPLKWGCQKHCYPPKELPRHLIEIAKGDYLKKILNDCSSERVINGPLDISTAITGIVDMEHYDQMKLNTSSGYPFNLGILKTKESLIRIERDEKGYPIEVKLHSDVHSIIEGKSELRKNGIRPFTVFQDTLKDERRKESKLIMKDGTRVFSQSPIDYTIETRQYTLDFAASYMKNRSKLEHAVGISPNSPEWTSLVVQLKQKGNNIISGDFSDYGPRIWSTLVRASGEIINKWYELNSQDPNEKEHSKVRTIMIEEIATCYHICNDLIYQTFCGIPSGHPLTVILNSMVHSLLIRVSWLEMMKSTEFSGLSNFHKHATLVTYGDDHLLSVSDSIKALFNCLTLSKYLATYDFKYTDATKLGNEPYTTLERASFLKCGFKKHSHRLNQWFAPIEEISIHECAQWVFKSANLQAATIENADQSLRLSYGHGKEYFDNWKATLNASLKKKKLPILTLTWEECDEMFFEDIEMIIPGEYKKWNVRKESLVPSELTCREYFMDEDELPSVLIVPSSFRSKNILF